MSVSVLVLQTNCPPLRHGGNSKAWRKHCAELKYFIASWNIFIARCHPRHVVVSAGGVLIPDSHHQALALHDKLIIAHLDSVGRLFIIFIMIFWFILENRIGKLPFWFFDLDWTFVDSKMKRGCDDWRLPYHKLELRVKVWFDVLVECSSLIVANLELTKPCMRIMDVDKSVGVLTNPGGKL